ncbi:MFS transporter [Halalkalibacter sp. APA_J-10(15)]|uniref:MFS transporter n=1 Tax=unclassified Halalkalibacter TaxID=2893063 RepID=UPI001FF5E5E1|nr:MFS transporter [Halalkalibacter sp. APA_J-10(15)]MCK0471245.1 MFS transporter [Halalkalibacter sp. APA_J-10(15)]
MEEKKTWDIISISSIPLVMTLGNSMLIPVLPQIERELQISSFQVSMLITVYSIVAILCIPIAGYVSDRIGRKRVIIPSLVITAIGGGISAFASWKMNDPYSVLVFGRLLQGIGAAGAAPIVMPLVGDMFTEEKDVSRGLGIIETSNTLGKVLSPILGAALALIVWYMPFFAIPIFCFISIIALSLLVKEPKMKEKPLAFKAFIKSLLLIFKQEGKWLYAVFIVGGISMFVLFGVLFYLSDLLEKSHQIDGIKKGIILAIPLAALCCASFATGKVIGQDKQKMKWMTVFGVSLLTIALFAMSFSQDIYLLLTALLVSGVGIGIALPSLDALVTEGIEMAQRGSITSLYSSMRFGGVALGPPVFSMLMKTTHAFTFLLNAGICILALVVALLMIKPEQKIKITWD